jgi:hypothetical protein
MTNNIEQKLEALLPRSYYEGNSLEFRIERMVASWQRAIRSNVELSTELEESLNGTSQGNMVKDRRHPEHIHSLHGPERRKA